MADKKQAPVTLSNLRPAPGSTQARKPVGRGPGFGPGQTLGHGHKGNTPPIGGGATPWCERGR